MADENGTPTDENNNGVTVEQGSQAATATIDAAEADAQRQAAAEQELIGGKFKTTEDLLEAYKNLERKMSQGGAPEDDPVSQTETGENTEEAAKEEAEEASTDDENPYGEVVGNALKEANLSVEDVQKEFADNGTLSEESFEAFDKAGFPRAMVEAYMRGIAQANENTSQITETQITQIKDSVGGEEAFSKLQQYLATQATPEQVQTYNDAISSGDFAKASKAVADAQAAYQRDIGTEGDLIGGKTAAGTQGYGSEADMQADMRKPEYKTSQAFRDQVAAKIAASPNLFQTR